MLNLLDLFSGIGGFSLGMEATKRINTVAFCEKDEYCRKVLKKHWSNTQQYIDIRDIDGTKISADIISGGFPCQPFSVAGKRKGTTDDRYLWDEMLRVITEVKPRWVVGENVQGIINIDNGLVLRQVQTDLEAQGFQVQCFLIPASGIGAWHKRNRVWIIANSNPRLSIGENKEIQARGNTIDSSSKDVSNSEHTGPQNKSWRRFGELEKESQREKETRNQSSLCFTTGSSDVSNSNSRLRRRRGTIKESGANEIWGFYPTQEEQTGQHIRSKAIGCDAISEQAKSWWQTQSSFCGVPDGISYGLDKGRVNRIKSLGNSIVPQIAFEIGKAILAAEDDKEHSIQGKEY